MTLQDVFIILIGTLATACIFACGLWVRDNWTRITDHYLTDHVLHRLRIMSSDNESDADEKSNQESIISPATTTLQNNNNGIATPTTDSNELLLQAKAQALAAMVKAKKIGETDGIKLVFGVAASSSNPRYIAARAALKAELERLDNHFPNQTPEQKANRQELGLVEAN